MVGGAAGEEDVPSPIDFHREEEARAWVADTVARRPYRARFFAAFAEALNGHGAPPLRVLELGSGPGHLAKTILRRCAIAEYVALDFSEAMHALARDYLGETGNPVTFLTRDFRDAQWNEGLGGFDAVVTHQAAHEMRHKRHLRHLLSATRACLKPGGMLLYCDHHAGEGRHPDLMATRDEQIAAMAEAGFPRARTLLEDHGLHLIMGTAP
jgi:SAM-dependent methyltransferase